MEGTKLTVVDLSAKDLLRQMGNCIQYGLPCLLQVRLAVSCESVQPGQGTSISTSPDRANVEEVLHLHKTYLGALHAFHPLTHLSHPLLVRMYSRNSIHP